MNQINYPFSKASSVYIHIPFCKSICSYCDFYKIIHNDKYINDYLNALSYEIDKYYNNEIIETIYIGGGTPNSLTLTQFEKLINIIKKFNLSPELEFTVELNIEHIERDFLQLLYNNGVNRLSIGVQTFNQKYLKLLNRKHNKQEVFKKIETAKKIGFKNISVDLMYGIPGQTLKEIETDISYFIKLDVSHISTYSLILEPRTKLFIENIQPIDENMEYEMFKLIKSKLKQSGFEHYEISNYCKPNFESRHNLVYWNNLEYYGFGMGASGYINNIRYKNITNINKYIKLYFKDKQEYVNKKTKLENEFILGFRKIKGINKSDFYKKYGYFITELEVIRKLLKEGKLIESEKYIYIPDEYIYVSNEILINFMV